MIVSFSITNSKLKIKTMKIKKANSLIINVFSFSKLLNKITNFKILNFL